MKKISFTALVSMVLSCVICSIAVNWVALPNGFVVTGITGLAMTAQSFTGINYALIYYGLMLLILVLTFVMLGYREVSNILFLSFLYPLVLWVLNHWTVEIILKEKLIAVMLFGVIYGVGAGITYRLGYSYGGTDTLAKILKTKVLKAVELKHILLALDGIIMAVMLLRFSLDVVAYALVGQIIYVNSMNYVIFNMGPKLYEIQIVCENSKAIESFVIHEIHKSATLSQVTGSYSGQTKTQVDCVCNSREYVQLREFIRDELDGQLVGPLFNKIGRAFASYYYGEADSPYFPGDIDNYALEYFGSEQYYSDKFQDEAYLFIPFDENYYQAMAKVMEKRFVNWQGQSFDEATLEPSDLAEAMMEYLDCECTYFPSMTDDDPIMSAYNYAKRESLKEGFVPVLIKADDETLLECLVMNADPDNDADIYEFDLKTVTEYRKKMLSAPIKDGKAVLEELTGQRKEEAEDDDMDWDEEVLGEMEGGYDNRRFSSYWNSDNDMTYPLILAKIPVKNPWELFAWLPFGNWNECPDTPELMAVAKYWFEQHGAVPAAMSHDELEFLLPAPVSQEKAMEVAAEQYGFCPDIVDQEQDDPTVGNLADVLRQSTVWYFWWD